jgi:hypothetical protein
MGWGQEDGSQCDLWAGRWVSYWQKSISTKFCQAPLWPLPPSWGFGIRPFATVRPITVCQSHRCTGGHSKIAFYGNRPTKKKEEYFYLLKLAIDWDFSEVLMPEWFRKSNFSFASTPECSVDLAIRRDSEVKYRKKKKMGKFPWTPRLHWGKSTGLT